MFRSVNPATGETIAEWPLHEDAEVERRLGRAMGAYQALRAATMDDRAGWLRQLAAAFSTQRDQLATTATSEMGKPLADARAEIDKCVAVCEHYAEIGPDALGPEPYPGAVVRYEPIGPLLAIMPWNFPFWQVARVLAPAIAVGNPVLLKHAENVLGTADALQRLVVEHTALPDGTLVPLNVETDSVPALLADPRVRAVTLTGSVRAGRAVAEIAGRQGKKSVLELGGSDPFIVLDDADLEAAAKAAATSRLFNSGQACIAAKRYIVHRGVQEEFVDRVRAHFEAAVVGDPLAPATTIGPMAREDLRDQLHRQVEATLAHGGRAVLGGSPINGPGFFYAPTLLTDLTTDAPSVIEETFGPVGSVLAVDDVTDAVRIANDTEYGLGACVFSSDPERADAVGAQLEVGLVALNGIVASRPDLPFGGVKASGYGRELGMAGLREFANVKTVLG